MGNLLRRMDLVRHRGNLALGGSSSRERSTSDERAKLRAVSEAVDHFLQTVEQRRQTVSAGLSPKHRSALGQFFTPCGPADFLAGLLELPESGVFRVLDPGAGVGSLSAAVVARVIEERPDVAVEITAFELDEVLVPHLVATLDECVATAKKHGCRVSFEARRANFVEYATGWLFEQPLKFDAVIANPPYKKVSTSSPERVAAATRGLRASNLYTIFAGLAADLLADGGQISLIVPRSWANGPYHEPFRRYLLDRISLDFLHVYEQRGKVFADAEVLQENVVLHGIRGPQVEMVTLSTSTGDGDARVERIVPLAEIVRPDDPHAFVRIPVDARATCIAEQMARLPATLADLDLTVSTGRVVDFRAKDHLRRHASAGAVPLIYPGHFAKVGSSGRYRTARSQMRCIDATRRSRCCSPTRRSPWSSDSAPKRNAAEWSLPSAVPMISPVRLWATRTTSTSTTGETGGLPLLLALGLSAFLNCTLVDDYVRSFSGHTQINATDLRQLRYPSVDELVRLGGALSAQSWPRQSELDAMVADYLPAVSEPVVDLQAA
jgi:adenine-specific DNA-methyltransferase